MSEEERWKVIRYVREIFASPVMHDPDEGDPSGEYADLTNPVPLTLETLDEGKAIYTRECMVCHGGAGRGQGPYRQVIQPGPPDFGDGGYGDYTDADYFWRISEGVPWSAMPAWKIEYSEVDRWKLVHYIRTMFTQTEDRPPAPPEDQEFLFPDLFKTLTIPASASFERGRQVYLQQCAHCHGLAGEGKGWDGEYLNPQPTDFREMAGKEMTPEAQGEHLARVTFGIQDTAMPSWGEFMTEGRRWDVVKYLIQAFAIGKPVITSAYGSGEMAANYVLASSEVYLAEGHTISVTRGAELYPVYCATCHGDSGQGNGPGTVGNASMGPTGFPEDMGEAYIFWRIWEGVPDSTMYPFRWLLSDEEVWDLTMYMQSSSFRGGGQ